LAESIEFLSRRRRRKTWRRTALAVQPCGWTSRIQKILRGRRKNSTSSLRSSGFGQACAVPAQNFLNAALTTPSAMSSDADGSSGGKGPAKRRASAPLSLLLDVG